VTTERSGDRRPAAAQSATQAGPLAARPLTCTEESPPPITVFSVAGQLDLTTAADARAALHKALAEQPDAIVLDLAGLVVTDDVALTVFTAFGRAAAAWPGCAVLLSAPDAEVLADLHRMAVNRALPVYRDRASALAAAKKPVVPRRFAARLWGAPSAAAAARDIVAQACAGWQLPHLIDDAQVVITELVSNAVRHAEGDLRLLVLFRDRLLHLSVADTSEEQPHLILPDPDTGEGGRGLLLIDAVAAAWGSSPTPDGKVVWATLRTGR
jgi:anti-anti-sigma regulatory factor/anti-sigma regulatory factor (Ser/Thr protein kinase)